MEAQKSNKGTDVYAPYQALAAELRILSGENSDANMMEESKDVIGE
jgi:hypothetical protein